MKYRYEIIIDGIQGEDCLAHVKEGINRVIKTARMLKFIEAESNRKKIENSSETVIPVAQMANSAFGQGW